MDGDKEQSSERIAHLISNPRFFFFISDLKASNIDTVQRKRELGGREFHTEGSWSGEGASIEFLLLIHVTEIRQRDRLGCQGVRTSHRCGGARSG